MNSQQHTIIFHSQLFFHSGTNFKDDDYIVFLVVVGFSYDWGGDQDEFVLVSWALNTSKTQTSPKPNPAPICGKVPGMALGWSELVGVGLGFVSTVNCFQGIPIDSFITVFMSLMTTK